ncbi:MAG: ribonuclease P protein subunit [Candidatus Bathyarchaeota archaeon]|nr:ribonuclease P protein subunit [Candidatus Bathyarchaeota archaeon]
MISPKYLIYHDLIGFHIYAKLKSELCNNSFSYIGVVIDETYNMLITEKENKVKKYIKKDHIFRLKLNEDLLEVDGSKIIGIPENRLRRLKKKKWMKI